MRLGSTLQKESRIAESDVRMRRKTHYNQLKSLLPLERSLRSFAFATSKAKRLFSKCAERMKFYSRGADCSESFESGFRRRCALLCLQCRRLVVMRFWEGSYSFEGWRRRSVL